MFQRRYLLWAFASILIILVLTTLPRSAAQIRPLDSWPAFRMLYRDWGPYGPNGAMALAVIKIDYYEPRHWRLEVLKNEGNPSNVGTWTEYLGDRIIGYDADFNRQIDTSYTDAVPNEVYVPTNWLIPDKIAFLRSRPGVVIQDAGPPGSNIKITGLPGAVPLTEVMTWTQVGPCVNMADPGDPPYYPNCVDGKITWVEEYTYLKDLEIPIRINYYTNGELTHWVEVLELTFF